MEKKIKYNCSEHFFSLSTELADNIWYHMRLTFLYLICMFDLILIKNAFFKRGNNFDWLCLEKCGLEPMVEMK